MKGDSESLDKESLSERLKRLISEPAEPEKNLEDTPVIRALVDEPPVQDEDTAPIRVARTHRAPAPFGGRSTPRPSSSNRENEDLTPTQHLEGNLFPKKVPEIDADATRVSPSAYPTPVRHPQKSRRNLGTPTQRAVKPSQATLPGRAYPKVGSRTRKKTWDFGRSMGCILRTFFVSLFIVIILALCGISIMFYQYYVIASTLPDIQDLQQKASQFETTRILDRNGNVLYEILDPNAGRRTYVPLEDISPYLVAATIATEDKGFYSHPGFDIIAIGRAFYQNYQGGDIVSGASTITQQLARILLFSPEERTEQTYSRKIREAILAAEITRRYSKDEILELYLNEIYFGNLAYGVEAAAETYFKTTANQLTLGQAAFLAGLPQAPSVYDIYTDPEAVYRRLEDVLVLMYQSSIEQGCIYVSNSPELVCVDPIAVTNAATEIKNYSFDSPDIQIRYPHWVNYIRSLLEEQFDAQTIYRSGFVVHTTLSPGLQDAAQNAVSEQIQSLSAQKVTDGALVIIRPGTGEILAMVGSADFYNEAISGQVNMAVSPRQPGSAIKPLTYLTAFEKGWTASTLIWDVPSEFPPSGQPDDPSPKFKPVNYDKKFHGPVTVRSALANSYNIPAVKTLNFVGIYDNSETPSEDGLIAMARRLGITTLTRPDYGLSLTLGGGEVTLLELTNAYAAIANNGRYIPTVAISRITDHNGDEVYRYQQLPGEQVLRPEHTFLISSILSDNEARTPAFGSNSILRLSFQAAVKTGTTNDVRDNWTIGYTPDAVVGVWVGNADYSPMENTSGIIGAAPVWAEMMETTIQQLTGGNPQPFVRPPGIVEQVICAVSGTYPSNWCPKQQVEFFAADQPPLPKEQDLWRKAVIDTWTGLLASPVCSEFTDEQFVLNVQDEWARKWIKREPQGLQWAETMGFQDPVTFAPSRECRADDPRPNLVFVSPGEGETISASPLEIFAVVDATEGFESLRLEFGRGEKPIRWEVLHQGRERIRRPELLYSWEIDGFPEGVVTLRLYLKSTFDTYAEKLLHLLIRIPTPTPTATPTQTPLPTSTSTPSPTSTSQPTPSPTWSPTPSQTTAPPP